MLDIFFYFFFYGSSDCGINSTGAERNVLILGITRDHVYLFVIRTAFNLLKSHKIGYSTDDVIYIYHVQFITRKIAAGNFRRNYIVSHTVTSRLFG